MCGMVSRGDVVDEEKEEIAAVMMILDAHT